MFVVIAVACHTKLLRDKSQTKSKCYLVFKAPADS